MGEAVVADEVTGLGSFTTSWATEEENDGDCRGGEARGGILRCLGGRRCGRHRAGIGFDVGHFAFMIVLSGEEECDGGCESRRGI